MKKYVKKSYRNSIYLEFYYIRNSVGLVSFYFTKNFQIKLIPYTFFW